MNFVWSILACLAIIVAAVIWLIYTAEPFPYDDEDW